MPFAEVVTQEQSDAALGRRIRELACELGQAVYIPPTLDERSPIQVITLEDALQLDENSLNFSGEFYPVAVE